MIDGYTRVCGVIGNPVEHTLSPVIQNTLAEQFSHNMVYVPFHVENDEVHAAVEGAWALNVLGLNVTVPHKSRVINSLAALDDLAAQIGAVNTLVRTKEGFKGYNTDMPGLYRAMSSEGIRLEEQEEAIVLGAGGVARAVAFLCASRDVGRVYMLNRSLEKAEKVAEEVRKKTGKDCIVPLPLDGWKELPEKKYLVIQATSVGMYPDTDHALIEDAGFYDRIQTGYDLIYKPFNTRFMQLVREAGGRAYHGLKMLLYQGIIAYELWNDVVVPEEMTEAVYEILKEKTGIRDER